MHEWYCNELASRNGEETKEISDWSKMVTDETYICYEERVGDGSCKQSTHSFVAIAEVELLH